MDLRAALRYGRSIEKRKECSKEGNGREEEAWKVRAHIDNP